MSSADVLLWSLTRCIVLATLGLWPSAIIARTISHKDTRLQGQLWLAAAVIPMLVPDLLTGFTYRLHAARLVQSEFATELLYAGLMLIRCVSAAACVRLMLPSSAVSRESLYAWQLLKPRHDFGTSRTGSGLASRLAWQLGWLRLRILGPWRVPVIAWCLMILISFQEFETVALLQIDRHPVSWTVWLFDAHAARQPLLDTLALVVRPLLTEMLLIGLAAPLLLAGRMTPGPDCASTNDQGRNCSAGTAAALSIFTAVWLMTGLFVMLAWPLISHAAPLARGLRSLHQQTALLTQSMQQILVSLGFAAAAAVVALRAAAVLLAVGRPWLTVMVALPGLCGSLVVSLTLLALFQLPGMRSLYDTWLPMLMGSALAILPRAILIVTVLNQLCHPSSYFAAHLLSQSPDSSVRQQSDRLTWRLRSFGWFLAAILTTHWCFWDVTTASILRPVGLEPIITRLYNEMHYGRTEAIVLMTLLSAATPVLAGLTATVLWRFCRRHVSAVGAARTIGQ